MRGKDARFLGLEADYDHISLECFDACDGVIAKEVAAEQTRGSVC